MNCQINTTTEKNSRNILTETSTCQSQNAKNILLQKNILREKDILLQEKDILSEENVRSQKNILQEQNVLQQKNVLQQNNVLQATTPSTLITYSIVFVLEDLGLSDATIGQETVFTALQKSAQNGNFVRSLNLLLNANSIKSVYGKNVLTSTSVSTTGFITVILKTHAPTPSPKTSIITTPFLDSLPSQGYIWFPITIIVGGMLFLVLIYIIVAVKANKKSNDYKPPKSHDDNFKGFETSDSRLVFYLFIFTIFVYSFTYLSHFFFIHYFITVFLNFILEAFCYYDYHHYYYCY